MRCKVILPRNEMSVKIIECEFYRILSKYLKGVPLKAAPAKQTYANTS